MGISIVIHLWIALSNKQNTKFCRTGAVTFSTPQKYLDCLPEEGGHQRRGLPSPSHLQAVRKQLK